MTMFLNSCPRGKKKIIASSRACLTWGTYPLNLKFKPHTLFVCTTPLVNVVKFNVDGSRNVLSGLCCGEVLRDQVSRFIQAFQFRIFQGYAITAEVGIFLGFEKE